MRTLSFLSLLCGLFFWASCGNTQTAGTDQAAAPANDEVVAIGQYVAGKNYDQYGVATFAGGCFWCTEASFERIKGVEDVISGYSGGEIANPTYRQVANGLTKHAESIQVYFDPEVVSFEQLLEVFFVAHDPTTLNRQGPDKGPQYRSAIFYHSENQREAIESYISKLDKAGKFERPIVTQVEPFEEFWVAEAYHQGYYNLNPSNSYIYNVSRPKVEKVVATFPDLIKEEYQ